jgi:hypothetical protein
VNDTVPPCGGRIFFAGNAELQLGILYFFGLRPKIPSSVQWGCWRVDQQVLFFFVRFIVSFGISVFHFHQGNNQYGGSAIWEVGDSDLCKPWFICQE